MKQVKAIVFGLLAMLNSMAGSADEQYPITAPPDWNAQADAYARAAGLDPLHAGGKTQLRIWMMSAFRGEIAGFVVSSEGTARYSIMETLGKQVATVKGTQQQPRVVTIQAAPALQQLDKLQALDGRMLDCHLVADGRFFLIEGTNHGHHFVFSATNPDSCSDSDSELVTRTLQQLQILPGTRRAIDR